MERSLYLRKFRNIGFLKDERIVLNNSLEKGEMGNLVIVVGENNSGKSNVLDALVTFGQGEIKKRDITTLSYDPEDQKPELSLVVKDDKDEYVYRIMLNGQKQIIYPNTQKKIDFMKDNNLVNILKSMHKIAIERYGFRDFADMIFPAIDLLEKKNNDQAKKIITGFMDFLNSKMNNNAVVNYWNQIIQIYPDSIFVSAFEGIEIDKYEKLNELYSSRYGMDYLPQIVVYKDEPITNKSIVCRINDIGSNSFFISLFNLIGISLEEVNNTYNAFRSLNNKGALTTLERKINKKLLKISDDFNNLYFAETDKYKFEISLESETVYFQLFKGGKDIALDYQSTGFRWFFNLYFNLLCNNDLDSGDIIIMDEPATNLHISGQIELRKFLKEFAINNDLTIVLATHSPFLIDLDYLDELRVIVNKDNYCYINNDFSAIDADDPDSLKPIKTALTVRNHILFDPDRKVVFVEGITDYNYLLAFKKILNIEDDISFLPIKGVGNVKEAGYKERQIEISKRLIEIKKHNPILLVDGDAAGKSMQAVNKSQKSDIDVIALTDINPNFKSIESLFSENDLNNLGLKDRKGNYIKHSSTSALIKTFSDSYEFEKTTLSNFKSVFDELRNR